jgi:calcineurin-like phosphoesterase family protein/fibronectin type III domain protein
VLRPPLPQRQQERPGFGSHGTQRMIVAEPGSPSGRARPAQRLGAPGYCGDVPNLARALFFVLALTLVAALPTGAGQTGSATAAPRDRVAPTKPRSPRVVALTTASLTVSWKAATDNVRVTGYRVYRGGIRVAVLKPTRRSYTFGGLACEKPYKLAVQAADRAGNSSARASLVARTRACPVEADPVVVAAGDICASPRDCAPTAALIDQINPDRVLTLGDNAYDDGSPSDFMSKYEPNWGRFKSKTSPAPGNHEYHISGAKGYFDYFGSRAPAEYYSFDLGAWHLISLNSEISVSTGSTQETWLKADLAAHPSKCILAYWHRPRFSSGERHGSSSRITPLWNALLGAGADVVLVGHEHNYERFARQDANGSATPQGIRQFVVGTGGSLLYPFGSAIANSEVRNNTTHGVLELVLHPSSYEWTFVPVAGASFRDSGSSAC